MSGQPLRPRARPLGPISPISLIRWMSPIRLISPISPIGWMSLISPISSISLISLISPISRMARWPDGATLAFQNIAAVHESELTVIKDVQL